MHQNLLPLLVDPVDGTPLTVASGDFDEGGTLREGVLSGGGGRSYPVTGGIPRFVIAEDQGQAQVADSFGFKWQQRDSYDYASFDTWYHAWLCERYGFADDAALDAYLAGRRCILEVGCGGGMSASLTRGRLAPGQTWVGADISTAVDVARDRLGEGEGTHFVQADLYRLPFAPGTFDTIFSEGVLHHTPSTEGAIKALVPLLAPGGEILFYVYRKKGPIREFTDDYVRGLISGLPPEEAWAMLRPLTRLAQALAELKVEVDVPEAIPYLGIPAGKIDVQRLLYWHFAKLFWNDAHSFEGNNHVNFDWYHPRYAHRQTEDDLRQWCAEAGLEITGFNAQESGYTVRAVRS